MLVGTFILPHPPIMVPSVGGKSGLEPIQKTVQAMEEISHSAAELKPETIVIITPHGPVHPKAIVMRQPLSGRLKGDLRSFGSVETLEVTHDATLASEIAKKAEEQGIPLLVVDDENLDHGVLAPMHYVNQKIEGTYRLVSLTISFGSYRLHYDFGQMLAKIFVESSARILFVASGDLSHSLTENAPCEYSKEGAIFDEKVVRFLKEGKGREILELDPDWVEKANECGLRSICTALGVVGESEKFDVISYEGPYGVGYAVGRHGAHSRSVAK